MRPTPKGKRLQQVKEKESQTDEQRGVELKMQVFRVLPIKTLIILDCLIMVLKSVCLFVLV